MAEKFYVSSDIIFGKDAAKELPGILKEYEAKSVIILLYTY